jgi:predicted RNA-binding Zn ribbon-like protein
MAYGRSLEYAVLELSIPGDLAAALVSLDTLTHEPAVGPEDLDGGRTLRDALGRCFAAAAGGDGLPPRDVETLNSFAADEPPLLRLSVDGSMARVATDPVRCALSAVARDAIELLARHAGDLRRCEGCEKAFLDGSRGRRRRWCSMERCGNRAKVAGYRARQR